jgi:DNA-binding GntR family transcriptional regulator
MPSVSTTAEPAQAAPPFDDAPPRRLAPVQPRTMVEQAAEAVVAAAARGAFLPGDRLVEAEIARDLGISRVPVREALRLLESQGIVVSTPYKGMRLMQVTNGGVAELFRVRAALETLAVLEIIAAGGGEPRLSAARRAALAYEAALGQSDPAPGVAADVAFHAELCRASGNAVLHALWNGLARQLAVVWGLGRGARPAREIASEHRDLIERLVSADASGAQAALHAHFAWHAEFDFEGAIEQRRLLRR